MISVTFKGKYIMQNAEYGISTMYNLQNIRCGKNLLNSVYFAVWLKF